MDIRSFQLRLLPILLWFHNFCVHNNLLYYIVGGTMLGAFRHQGFIPWDDDMDVAMPRSDYRRFINLTKGHRFGDYIVESLADERKDYWYPFAKVYDTSTTLIELVHPTLIRGIYLDVFPIDGAGFTVQHACDIKSKLNKLWHKRHHLKSLSDMASKISSHLMPSNKTLMRDIDELLSFFPYDSSELVGRLCRPGFNEIMPKKIYGEPKPYRFEDITVYGVADPHSYLTAMYGDYMKLPPEKEQVGHHLTRCKCIIDKPFLLHNPL